MEHLEELLQRALALCAHVTGPLQHYERIIIESGNHVKAEGWEEGERCFYVSGSYYGEDSFEGPMKKTVEEAVQAFFILASKRTIERLAERAKMAEDDARRFRKEISGLEEKLARVSR